MYKFSEFLVNKGFSKEQAILSQLLHMDMIQQAKLDISLHNNAIANQTFGLQGQQLNIDKGWKYKFIDIIQGKETSPETIQQTIDNIENDMETHQGRISNKKTGSSAWHEAWIAVYKQWLTKLQQLLGEFNG